VTIPKGNIIEILMSDEEEIEVSDGKEAQSQTDPACLVPVPVTVNHVETSSTVWVTRTISFPALDKLADQLADLTGRLIRLATEVQIGDLVVARFTEDEDRVDMLQEKVMDSLDCMAYSDVGRLVVNLKQVSAKKDQIELKHTK